MNTPNRDGAKFKSEIKSIILDLNSRSGLDLNAENLKPYHWKKIWELYDNFEAELLNTKNDEINSVKENFSESIKSILLKAHDIDESEFAGIEIMESYDFEKM